MGRDIELRNIVIACREAEDTLANRHGDAFMLWGRASHEGNQTLCDQLEKECISLRRRQTMNTNKLYKVQNELCRRDIQSLRGLIG
jgi:3'-phosphoadenosine 5'-phosphosulfate sulfotransferase